MSNEITVEDTVDECDRVMLKNTYRAALFSSRTGQRGASGGVGRWNERFVPTQMRFDRKALSASAPAHELCRW